MHLRTIHTSEKKFSFLPTKKKLSTIGKYHKFADKFKIKINFCFKKENKNFNLRKSFYFSYLTTWELNKKLMYQIFIALFVKNNKLFF